MCPVSTINLRYSQPNRTIPSKKRNILFVLNSLRNQGQCNNTLFDGQIHYFTYIVVSKKVLWANVVALPWSHPHYILQWFIVYNFYILYILQMIRKIALNQIPAKVSLWIECSQIRLVSTIKGLIYNKM